MCPNELVVEELVAAYAENEAPRTPTATNVPSNDFEIFFKAYFPPSINFSFCTNEEATNYIIWIIIHDNAFDLVGV